MHMTLILQNMEEVQWTCGLTGDMRLVLRRQCTEHDRSTEPSRKTSAPE